MTKRCGSPLPSTPICTSRPSVVTPDQRRDPATAIRPKLRSRAAELAAAPTASSHGLARLAAGIWSGSIALRPKSGSSQVRSPRESRARFVLSAVSADRSKPLGISWLGSSVARMYRPARGPLRARLPSSAAAWSSTPAGNPARTSTWYGTSTPVVAAL